MAQKININIDRIIYVLLCLYAFFIPLEKVLKVFLGIDTIFKPYRIIALMTIAVFAIKSVKSWRFNPSIKEDIFLYLVFIYGLIITFYRMMTTPFGLGHLYNDLFQMGLYLCVFIIFKHSNLSQNQVFNILKYLGIGIILNASYVFYTKIFLFQNTRTGGLMDNPNYLAFSLVVLVSMLLIHREKFSKWYKRIFWILTLLLSTYVFLLAGSRTNLAVFVVCIVIIFTMSSLKEKLGLIGFISLIIVALQLGGLGIVQSRGPLALVTRIQKTTTDDPRFAIWDGVIRASQETNFLGLGIGQFKERFHEFYYEENIELIKTIIQRDYFLSPHSDYFSILITYGITGLCFYLIFVFQSGKKIISKSWNARDALDKEYYHQSFVIFIALILFGITAENFNSPLYWILLSAVTCLDFFKINNTEVEYLQA